MRLVAHVAKKYQNSEEDMEDLISIGTIGLMKAIATYKEDYGSRLATYAARCIDNELLMYFRAKKKVSREVSLYEPIGMDKEGNQIHLLDIVESEEPDVVEMMERTRQIEKLLGLVPKVFCLMAYGLICAQSYPPEMNFLSACKKALPPRTFYRSPCRFRSVMRTRISSP